MAIRKDANTLTSSERAEFVAAVLEIKRLGIYDQFVLRHARANMTAIHRCPAFLPWHRRFIYDFEIELQRASGNPNLGLPYWNWPEGGETASLWDDDLLGGNGDTNGVVRTGPFRSGRWTIVNRNGQANGALRREMRQNASSLPTISEITGVVAQTPYDTAPWDASASGFRNQLEGFIGANLHNRGHMWVGGSMLPMTSPNDPVFFMHHCMVDKIWHDWQVAHPSQGYQPTGNGPFGQNLTDPMDSTPTPNNRPIDVLDSNSLGIEYQQSGEIIVPPIATPQLLPLDESFINASINIPGEVIRFQIDAPEFASYRLETSGNSDTVMSLFGPNDASALVTVNDDGGENLNSRIVQSLSAGSYILEIRLYNPNSLGSFSISGQPIGTSAIPILAVNGVQTNAAISFSNESDLYRFTVTNPGAHNIETEGQTDTFISLYGPNSQTALLDNDDDSGNGLNSRLRWNLPNGEYFVRVRHYSPVSTGSYSIRVNR